MSQSNPYAANVNRAKTKKWVEAKSYSYDGDDWGDVDDYDEYGGYNEPEPEPVSRPTGLRQRGQSASKMPQEAYDARQDIYQSPVDVRQPYENLGRPPPQQQHGGRSFTTPHPKQQPMMVRTNSFDRDDDRRAFSAGGSQAPANDYIPTDHTARLSQSQDKSMSSSQHNQSLGHTSQPQPPPAQPTSHPSGRSSAEVQPRHGEQTQSAGVHDREIPLSDQVRQTDPSSRAQSMASNNSGLEFHNRRDFSPSALPNPLHTHGLPSPHGHDSRSSSRHPPRKSSLGQDNAPTDPFPTQPPPILTARDKEAEDITARDRAGSGTSKQLPFVRPADIYRRMQEEKEKERQSQDLSRSSIEAIQNRSDERPNLGKSQDSASSQRLRSPLDPVTERRSEYGMGEINLENQEASGERRPTSSKTFNFPKQASNRNPPSPQSSFGPMLPDVSRVSGFGESFFGSTGQTEERVQASMLDLEKSFASPEAPEQTRPSTGTGLQHQLSLGFTSAVHQAFDTAEDQVPPTPSSTQGSSVVRSASGGTSTVSPIISRGPSTATDNWNARLPGIDNVSTPMIPERPEGNSSRPLSSDSITTPTQIARDSSLSQDMKPQQSEKPPPSFIPGYRRDSDPPSPDNSPRRTPALETSRQLRRPQEVELAAATPTEPDSSTDSNSVTSEANSEDESSRKQPTESDPHRRHVDTYTGNQLRDSSRTGSPLSPRFDPIQGRTDSSSSSRVRNLADKFENVSRPGSAQSTPRASILGANAQRKEDPASSRPLVDHRESFRPHLPGGWESSASIAPAAASKTTRAPFPRQDLEQSNASAESTSSPTALNNDLRQGTAPSSADQQPSSITQIKDASEEAFAAVAAAGSALVGAFGAAVGIEQHDPSTTTIPEAQSTGPSSKRGSRDYGPIANDPGPVHSETSGTYLSQTSDDEASATAPRPLPRSNTPPLAEPSKNPAYFAVYSERGAESNAPSVDGLRNHPPALPLLSTDIGPEQYESDRLRKEIVRELTPMSASEPTTAETDNSNYQPTLFTDPSVTRPGHDSGFLPKEYESYWNDGSSEDEGESYQKKSARVDDAITAGKPDPVVVQPLHLSQNRDPGSLAPSAQDDPTQERPQMLPHRFSWEQPLQEIPIAGGRPREQTIAPASPFLQSAIYPQDHSHQPREPSTETYASPTVQTVSDPAELNPPVVPDKNPPNSLMRGNEPHWDGTTEATKSLPEPPSGLEMAPSNSEEQRDGSPTASHIGGQSSLSTSGPEHPPHQRQEHESPRIEQPLIGPSPPQVVQVPSMPPPANSQLKFPPFREILALKDPNDRIRAYDDTRDQFANLDTRLAHWLAVTTNDLPEHADLLTSSGRPAPIFQGHRPSQSRSKLGSLLPSGGQAGHHQQPQQYLNANSGQSSAPAGNGPGQGMGDVSPQGMSPSGSSSGKLSSQQVQAKGKDLLHTAGVFGGKANFAAKGLFSKGKSKLRAASGNEKGTSRSSPGPEISHETQQQHIVVKPQTPTKALLDLRTNSSKAVARSPSPELQYSSRSSQQETTLDIPSDTPSAESSSQSQLGDDECSEESEPTKQARPSRTNNLYLKHGLGHSKDSRTLRDTKYVEDNASFFHKKTSSADSYVESPKTVHTPRSTTSSDNRTPTQASFANGSPSATLRASRRDDAETSLSQREALEDTGTHAVNRAHSGRNLSDDIHSPSQASYSSNIRTTTPTNHYAVEQNKPQKQSSGDSKSTVRHVQNEGSLVERAKAPLKPSELPKTDLDLISRAPARMIALAASEVSPTAKSALRGTPRTSRSRPVSLSRDSLGVPGAPQDYSNRGASIDSMPGSFQQNGPISPISPSQLTAKDVVEHRGRTGPKHYGLDHDFVPDSDNERIRRRPRSYSKSSAITRPSQDSYRFQELPTRLSSDMLPQDYSGQIVREKSPAPGQQAPEYHIEGTSPPLEWPSESASRSRRGSRSSAFFRSLTPSNSPRLDEHPLPSPSDARPTASPARVERREKVPGILRSLTGNSGGGTATGQGNSKSNPAPSGPPQGRLTQAVAVTTPQVEDDEFPSRGTSRSVASKFGKRLQRSSTSGNPEQSTPKKKRFSAIGSLFGRSNPKRHSSSASPQTPSQQPFPAPKQSSSNADYPRPSKSQQLDRDDLNENYTPPPPSGYYAPRSPQSNVTPPPPVPKLPPDRRSTHRTEDVPAYVQDTQLRQPINQRLSSLPQNHASPRSSKTFPQATPAEKSKQVPRASTTRGKSREKVVEQPSTESKPSSRSWARFSQHKRSKSRQEHQTPSSQTPTSNPSPAPAPSRGFRMSQQPYHDPTRPDSPPPPPPPPKDEWHQARPRESMSRNPISRSSQHGQIPSHSSNRPISGQNRESLPPLQTNLSNKKRQSAIASAKTMTPEEKRKSRQLEIERSTISPDYREQSEEEQPVVMSATSFPGQMWQPEYAHWDGD